MGGWVSPASALCISAMAYYKIGLVSPPTPLKISPQCNIKAGHRLEKGNMETLNFLANNTTNSRSYKQCKCSRLLFMVHSTEQKNAANKI